MSISASTIAPVSPTTLRFRSDALEHEFRDEYSRSIVRPSRAVIVLIIAFFVAYGAFHAWTDRMGTLWPLRAAIVVMLGIILASTWHPAFVHAQPWILAAGALTAAGAILAILTFAPESGIPWYPWIGATIIVTFALLRVRFPIALATTLVMLVAYVARVATEEYPSEDRFGAALFLLTSMVIGAFAGWNIENYARTAFLTRKRLEAEQARSERLLLNVLPESIAERLPIPPRSRTASARRRSSSQTSSALPHCPNACNQKQWYESSTVSSRGLTRWWRNMDWRKSRQSVTATRRSAAFRCPQGIISNA